MPAGRLLILSEVLHIYTRVSTLVQADEGMSLEFQKELGIKRAQDLGFDFKLWNEGGKSSNHEELDKRPMLSQLFNEIKRGSVKHLFVYDQSRLSRNDTVSSIFRIECAKQGVTLYNKEGKYNLSDHNDHFMKQILDAVGQFDNAQRAERTRLGKLARIRQGNWMGGPPPYGYEIQNRKLVINDEEAKWVKHIYEQYAERVPLIDVKFELDSKGVEPRRKLGTWTMGSLQALLRNTHYLGYWDFKDGKTGEEIRVDCPRILPSALWSKVQKTKEDHLSKRNSTNAVKHFYMLKNVLRCGHCGTWLSGTFNPKQPSKKHYYCPKKMREWGKRSIEQEDKWKRGRVCEMTRSLNIDATDELVWDTVLDVITKSRTFREKTKVEILGEDYLSAKGAEEEIKNVNQKVSQLKKMLAKVQDALARVETDRLMERLSPDQYPVVRGNISKEKLAIEVEIEQLTAKADGIGRDRKWFKWLDNFRQKIDSFKDFTPAQRKEVLAGLLTSVDVFMIDSQTHWLELQFNVPLVDDELVYRDPSNKKLGYAIKNGMTTCMVELSQKSHSKKKPIEPTT
jgi:DNA invertase Pin-like site-specific DNA recombinase